MAIALDTSAQGYANSTSLTYSHTCTGNNLILFVGIDTDTATDVVTGVTYNSVAMTRINAQVTGGAANRFCYLYYLLAPATGANNVVISITGTHDIHGESASYTGAQQSGVPDAQGTNTVANPATSITKALTTIADNCWMVSVVSTSSGIPTGGTGLTARQTQNTSGIGDSNGAITPAGSYSMTWNFPTGGDGAICQASFAPAPATTTSTSSSTSTSTTSTSSSTSTTSTSSSSSTSTSTSTSTTSTSSSTSTSTTSTSTSTTSTSTSTSTTSTSSSTSSSTSTSTTTTMPFPFRIDSASDPIQAIVDHGDR